MEHAPQKKIAASPAAIKATEKVDKLLSFILANSPIDEEWKEIVWADSNYFVSNKGRVISLCNRKPRILKPFVSGNQHINYSFNDHKRKLLKKKQEMIKT